MGSVDGTMVGSDVGARVGADVCLVGLDVVGSKVGSFVGSLVGNVGAVVGANVGGLSHVVSPVGSQAPVVIPLSGVQLYCQVPDGSSIPQFIIELAPHIRVPLLTVTKTSFHPYLA